MVCLGAGQAVGQQMVNQTQVTSGHSGAIVNVSGVQAVTGNFEQTLVHTARDGIEDLTK